MKWAALAIAMWSVPAGAQDVCTPEAQARAQAAIRTLGALIDSSPRGADPALLHRDLESLVELPCLELIDEGHLPPFASVLGAQLWWRNGGVEWLTTLSSRTVVFPPDELPSLTRESAAVDDPLGSLLCSAADVECGRSTAGYRLRAEAAFEAHRRWDREQHGDSEAERNARRTQCIAEAQRAPSEERYMRWRSCVESTLEEQWVLPLGEFRAPSEGWLVVRGRRGHYSFCDQVSAYDLATGSVYSASSCSGLALRHDGSVDQGRTDAARGANDVAGRVPIEHLREAAWMILFMERVEQRRLYSERAELPEGIERRIDGLYGSGFGGMWGSSAQTRLSWAWIVRGRTAMQGILTWPDSYRAGEHHAAQLLGIAEAGISRGCTSAPLPRDLPLTADGTGVSAIDADPNARQQLEVTLIDRLRALRAPRCR